MNSDEQTFNRKRVCYEQNFQQARSLNDQMNRLPALAITLTGGLWFGASLTQNIDTAIRFGLLFFAGVCNLALVLAAVRIRDVLESYLEQIRAFDPESFASGRPDKPRLGKLGSYSMIGVYASLLIIGAVLSFAGAFGFYWPFKQGRYWGVLALVALLVMVFLFLTTTRRELP